jgi:hypothetical protein
MTGDQAASVRQRDEQGRTARAPHHEPPDSSTNNPAAMIDPPALKISTTRRLQRCLAHDVVGDIEKSQFVAPRQSLPIPRDGDRESA